MEIMSIVIHTKSFSACTRDQVTVKMMFLNAFILLLFFAVQCIGQINGINYDYYICQDGAVFTRANVLATMNHAWHIRFWGWPVGDRDYPHTYYYKGRNWNGVRIDRRVDTYNLVEFPIFENGTLYNAGPPETDRVVFDAATGTFAGILTHRGQQNNQFVPCIGQNRNQALPSVAQYFIPILNPTANPALIGFNPGSGSGTGSGSDDETD
ncbi:hypothetical protein V8E54_008836 [Elaphomyces granulatus]